MTERSWFWGGRTVGDAALAAPYGAPYTDKMFGDVLSSLLINDRTKQGVVPSLVSPYSGKLAVTAGSGSISVAAGIAMVNGHAYASDAAETISVSTPGTGLTYYYSLFVRSTTTTQQVRLYLSSPSTSSFPTATQIDGVTWDVLIYNLTVSDAGVITLYDRRTYAIHLVKRTAFVQATYGDLAIIGGVSLSHNSFDQSGAFLFLPRDVIGTMKICPVYRIGTTDHAGGNAYMQLSWYLYKVGVLGTIDYGVSGYIAEPADIYDDATDMAPVHGISLPDTNFTISITDPGYANYLGSPPEYAIYMDLARNGNDVLDTLTGDVVLFGFMCEYDAIG